ncbi:DUF1641 domain-containing protein [Halorubrum sp. SD626R]|uniref:DUF1641 domain-containing protein n=1 Tax=Halorubrum sp. SD626R TaxID=1419722 RepID=UPI000A826B5B|nr:DUF1641 domain-containing protein [Halorubrum sp. SD626R]
MSDATDDADDGQSRAEDADGESRDGGELDAEELDRADLESIVAENPEAVAAFVERLDAVTEFLDVVALGESALTDEMVVELAGTASTLAESADGLATDETVALAEAVGANGDELRDALETLVELQRSGALADLAEVAQVGSLASDALDDEMVRSLAKTGSALGEVADTAAGDDVRDGATTLLEGVGAAERSDPDRVGALGLARSVRDPEVQYGLGYVIAISKAIGRSRAADGD